MKGERKGDREASGDLWLYQGLHELLHRFFQPCHFTIGAELTIVFVGNAYCPGIVVGEGPEEASSFSWTVGGLGTEQALALAWEPATREEGKAYVRGERLCFVFWVGGLEAQKTSSGRGSVFPTQGMAGLPKTWEYA